MDCSSHMLKDFTPPEPLSGENEDKLCMIGLWLNFKHTEAQSRETAANAAMNEAGDTADQAEQFERLKAAVVERHKIMRAQFGHVADCFACSVAFGLTPPVKASQERTSPNHTPLVQLLVRWARGDWHSKTKRLQRV